MDEYNKPVVHIQATEKGNCIITPSGFKNNEVPNRGNLTLEVTKILQSGT
jgi:hypothetical protein